MDTVVLDVNETLFGLDPLRDAFEETGLAAADVDLWFARVLRDGFAAAATGGLATFPELARHHVAVLLDRTAATDVDAAGTRVVDAFEQVEAHPDVDRGLRTLAAGGLHLVAFTNGSAAVTRRFLTRAGLDDVVTTVHDATEAGIWKPAPAAYTWLCDEVGTPPAEAAMLAVHPWDVAGAMAAGMTGAWLDRDHRRWPAWLPSPDRSAGSLVELATGLVARD